MPLDLIALIAFLAIVLLALGLASVAFGRRKPLDEEDTRLASETLWSTGAFHDDDARVRAAGPTESPRLVRLLAGLLPRRRSEDDRLTQELGQAGMYRRAALTEYQALRNCLVLAVVIVAGMMALAAVDDSDVFVQIVLVGLIVAALAYSLPRLYVQSLGRARQARIQRALPDALDLIAMCMAGGLSFQEALDRVARDVRATHPDLATELRIVRRHAEYGSMAQAFRQFADRIDLPELKSLNAMVVQSERLGSNLVAPLDTFTADLRRDRRQRANAQAASAAVRMMLPMAMLLLPATMMLLWGPALVELRDFWRREQAPGGALALPEGFAEMVQPAELDQRPGPNAPPAEPVTPLNTP